MKKESPKVTLWKPFGHQIQVPELTSCRFAVDREFVDIFFVFFLMFLKIELLELWDLSRSFSFETIVRLALTRAPETFWVSRYGQFSDLSE